MVQYLNGITATAEINEIQWFNISFIDYNIFNTVT